ALEHRVRLELHDDLQVAARAAVDARLALARQPDAVVLVDARRDLHRQRLVLADAARAVAGLAGLGDDLAAAVALRAGLLDREESLRHADLASAVARGALLGLRARLRARALAGLAGFHRRDADARLGAA